MRGVGSRESMVIEWPLSLFKVATLASRRIGRVERLADGMMGSASFSFAAGRVQIPVSGLQPGSLVVVMKANV